MSYFCICFKKIIVLIEINRRNQNVNTSDGITTRQTQELDEASGIHGCGHLSLFP